MQTKEKKELKKLLDAMTQPQKQTTLYKRRSETEERVKLKSSAI